MKLRPLFILSLLGLCVSAVAAAPKDLPADRIDRELKRMRGLMKNAEMKLDNDVAGMDAAAGRAGTPVRRCCTSNLNKIGKALVGIQQETDRLRRCYDETGQVEHYGAVQFFKNDVDAYAKSVLTFADAADKEEAQGVYDAMIRGFLQMFESAKAVQRCGESPADEPAQSPQ